MGQFAFLHAEQVDTKNIKTLGGAWVHKWDGESSRASPVVADGMMFITAGHISMPSTRRPASRSGRSSPKVATSGMYKGVSVGGRVRLCRPVNGHIVAVDEKTGKSWPGPASSATTRR